MYISTAVNWWCLNEDNKMNKAKILKIFFQKKKHILRGKYFYAWIATDFLYSCILLSEKNNRFNKLWQWHQKFNGQIYKLFYVNFMHDDIMWIPISLSHTHSLAISLFLTCVLLFFALRGPLHWLWIHNTYWNVVRALIVLKIWCGFHWPFEWILVYIVYYSWYFMCEFYFVFGLFSLIFGLYMCVRWVQSADTKSATDIEREWQR